MGVKSEPCFCQIKCQNISLVFLGTLPVAYSCLTFSLYTNVFLDMLVADLKEHLGRADKRFLGTWCYLSV